MFKNALVYCFDQGELPAVAELQARLEGRRFIECGPTQQESAGWVAPRGEAHAPLVEVIGGQWLLSLCQETKGVPASAIRQQLEARLEAIEKQTGRKPKGKALRDLKDEIVIDLLPRAFAKRSNTPVWLDPKARRVLVGVASTKKADAILTRLLEALGGTLRLTALQTETSPAVSMAAWLTERDAPAGFTIDRECELKQPDAEKAAVRYTRHLLDIDEVGEHIRQGKVPTQLALTWHGRVSFVLAETLALKKIKLLDVVLESAGRADSRDDGGFDTDMAISTGELRQLLPELIEALGGELPADRPTPSSAPTSPSETRAVPA